MNYFAQGFVQGLADQLSTDINTRRAEARDFFNKQVEMARTTGLENRRRVKQAVENSTSMARQLNQMGVPKDIIMAVANQNPEDLGTFYEQVAKAQAAGIQTDEEFFRSFVEVGGNFMAPDEDFGTFFSRMYDPVVSTASQDPEAFNNDKKGGLFASMFGLNAMDRARSRLGETEIVDGLTAEQLLQYGDDVVPNKIGGDATVTFNYGQLAEAEKAAKGEDQLSISERNSINTRIQDLTTQLRPKIAQDPSYDTSTPEGQAAVETATQQEVYRILSEEYAGVPGVDSFLRVRLGVDDTNPVDAAEQAVEAPEPLPATEVAPEATPSPEPSPEAYEGATSTGPVDPTQEPELYQIILNDGRSLTFLSNSAPGYATYLDEDGNEVEIEVAQLRELIYSQ